MEEGDNDNNADDIDLDEAGEGQPIIRDDNSAARDLYNQIQADIEAHDRLEGLVDRDYNDNDGGNQNENDNDVIDLDGDPMIVDGPRMRPEARQFRGLINRERGERIRREVSWERQRRQRRARFERDIGNNPGMPLFMMPFDQQDNETREEAQAEPPARDNEARGEAQAEPPVPEAEVRVIGPAARRFPQRLNDLPGNARRRININNAFNRFNNRINNALDDNENDIVAIPIDEDGNREDDDDDFDDLVMMDFAQGRFEHRISALRASREYISNALFFMVKEGRTCISVLSGWGRSDQNCCNSIVQHCEAHPDNALFVSRQGRMPLHEACLRGACRHIIQSLLVATNNRGAKERDQQGNTPLHLLFVDYSASDLNNANLVWSPADLSQVVGDLLAVNPFIIASSTNAAGDTPLHSACMAPETMVDPSSIVQLLKANSKAATRTNRKNQTPLRLHCQRRNASPEVAALLLEEYPHALIVLDNERGWAPIHAAASNANFKLLRYLVEAFPESVKVQTSQRQTALHLLCQQHTHLSAGRLIPSIRNGNSTAFGADGNRSSTNGTPNVTAAVEFLLEADPQAIMHQDSTNGYTPLHLVCKTEGSRQVPVPVLRLLLGCNPRAAKIPDSQQYLPLHHACEMGANPEVIRALIEAYPDATGALTRKQDSALSLACTSNKSAETVQLLINANSQVLTQKNDYGFCPLHCVCRVHQPRMGIVKALVDACPSSVNLQTHSGETPFHLAGSNTGAFVGVLQLLAQTQARLNGGGGSMSTAMSMAKRATLSKEGDLLMEMTRTGEIDPYHEDGEMGSPFRHPFLLDPSLRDQGDSRKSLGNIRKTGTTNKMGNTPLHDACFRSTPYEHLEVIAKANPEYILVRNNAGYTPLQILCKNGRIDERIISTFAQMGGPEIFSVKDSHGNTPLHSAMRKDVDVASLRCLIRASPDALRCRTTYGDLPLHLACLRRCSSEVVQEVAMAASSGDVTLAVVPNLAGQTPIGIAMGEFQNICTGTISASRLNQKWIFQVLSTLVKIVHYGPVRCQQQGMKDLSLLKACVVLHRQNIRLDPTFIRQVIHVYPEEVKQADEDGNYPLHIEASIPIEKMSLLDGVCNGTSHLRMGILRILLEAYPSACSFRNRENHFPLGLMIQAGRVWGHTIAVALRVFPPALHWYKGLDDRFSSILLEKASKECGADTLFALLVSRPGLFDAASHRRGITNRDHPPHR